MTTLSKKKLIAVNTLLSKNKLMDDKKEIVLEYTNGRTDSSRQMHDNEAAQLIGYLQKITAPNLKEEKMKNKILSLAHEMGWELPNGKVNIDRVNAWCTKYSPWHKELDKHSLKELPTLVTQFENVYKSFIKK